MPTEDELLQKLKEVEVELLNARAALADAKRRVIDSESTLIEVKLQQERLREELRIHRNETVNEEITERDKDIERFKQVLPSILENDKWISKKETK